MPPSNQTSDLSYRRLLLFAGLVLALFAGLNWPGGALAGRSPRSTAAVTSGAFTFQVVAQTGQNGLTGLNSGQVNDNGEVYFTGNFDSNPTYRVLVWANGQASQITLPGGAEFSGAYPGVYPTSNDDLVFKGTCGGQEHSMCILRENNTVERIDTGSYISHLPVMNNGYWLMTEPLGGGVTRVAATNGSIQTPAVEIVTNLQNSERYEARYAIDVAPDGAVLIYEFISVGGTSTTRLKFVGARNEVVVEKEQVSATSVGEYLEVPAGVNSFGDVLYSLTTYTPNEGGGVNSKQSLHIWPASGSGGGKMLDETPSFRRFDWPMTLGDNYRPVFRAYNIACDEDDRAVRVECNPYFVGFNLSADMFTVPCLELFGETCFMNGAPQLSENGKYVLANLSLASGGQALVVAGELSGTAWNNPSGGAWSEGANWTSGTVPDATADVLFNLPETYAVTVGTRTVGSVAVRQGSVAFMQADLDITSGLNVSGNARFTLPEGTVTTGELVVGADSSGRSPQAPQNTLAQVFISNTGTLLDGAPEITVGQATPGHLYLSGARIEGGALNIGSPDAAGSVVVANPGANPDSEWETGSVAIGPGSTLDIERGGSLRSNGTVVIGHAAGPATGAAVVRATNEGDFFPSFTNWLMGGLALGDAVRGRVYVSHGAILWVVGLFQAGLQTQADAFLSVDGSADVIPTPQPGFTPTVASAKVAVLASDVLLGMADDVQVEVNITNGGEFVMNGGNLSLGHEAGSTVTVVVQGINSHGVRARLEQISPVGEYPYCDVGFTGSAGLYIREGGQVNCGTMRLGVNPGSYGKVLVNGANGSSLNTVALCLGWDHGHLCQSAEGAQGLLDLRSGGLVSSKVGTIIGKDGIVAGDGVLAVGTLGFLVYDGGLIAPGITLLQDGRSASGVQERSRAITPGTLSITGTLTLSPTATIAIDVLGPDSYDKVVVNGSAGRAGAVTLLGGKLVIAFNNGYAPQAGDTFTFLTAESVTGGFDEVIITGLAPGFEYTAEFTNGKFTLTALNDGVATTEWMFRALLPIVKR